MAGTQPPASSGTSGKGWLVRNLKLGPAPKAVANHRRHLLALRVQAVDGQQLEASCHFAPLQHLPQQEREPQEVLTLLVCPADRQQREGQGAASPLGAAFLSAP